MVGLPYLLAGIGFIAVATWYLANRLPEGLSLAGGMLVLGFFILTSAVLSAVWPGRPSDGSLRYLVAGAITLAVMVPMGVRAVRTLRRR